MTIDQIRKLHFAASFRPFTLRLADGSRVHVSHPDFLWIHPDSPRTIVVGMPDEDGALIIDPLLVAAAEIGNGKSRSRRRN